MVPPLDLFQKWGLEFVGPIIQNSRLAKMYILVSTSYCSKWVEDIVLRDTKASCVAKFPSKNIMTKFGYPIELISDQGAYFLNDVIKELTQRHMILQKNSMLYYPRQVAKLRAQIFFQ